MTKAIDANGDYVAMPHDNLAPDNEMGFTARDYANEKAAKGHFTKHTNWISDSEMQSNPNAVIHNGSRVYSDGTYQPGDLIMIDGMEVGCETAVSLGLIASDGEPHSSPHADFMADAENAQEATDGPLEGADLLRAQLDMASGGNSDAVLNTFASDIVTNGTISDDGMRYAAKELGMGEKSVEERFSAMQRFGGERLMEALDAGDGLGLERVNFLVERHQNGHPDEQRLVRQMWTAAALGKLSQDELQGYFTQLHKPYEGRS
ncbi:hypothetical protein [Psychromarinibacter sp. S121]|uniref:hypothetical protein n=1 Tax=Psychromarinibacter sp. S121 TaxID=3415127 RepID=UPI003C7B49E0